MKIISLVSLYCFLAAGSLFAAQKEAYHLNGTYLEGCSCKAVCSCDMISIHRGCEGVGVLDITSGDFKGVDLSGGKIAIGMAPMGWVHAYVDGKTPAQREALSAFAKKAFAAFGKVEATENAAISISGKNGRYSVSVNGGKTMRLQTRPVLGGDKRTAITHNNVPNPMVPSYSQGKTVSGSFNGGGHSFQLKDSNSFFNDHVMSKGSI